MPATAQFTVAVDHDPYGCNDDPAFNQDTVDGVTAQIVSTYRRPRISANLNFVNAAIPLPVPGAASAPAIMWDIREASLTTQASDATHGHAQAVEAPTADQVNQILAFELGIFSAQSVDSVARGLNAGGAKGGPVTLATGPTGLGGTPGATTFDEFNAWTTSSGGPLNARRASISRVRSCSTRSCSQSRASRGLTIWERVRPYKEHVPSVIASRTAATIFSATPPS